jgi:hypothetical protein
MESPTATDKQNPLDSKDASVPTQQNTSKSLFRGTYGQVMSALKDAGLMTTPCTEAGFEDGKWEPGRSESSLICLSACHLSSNATWGTFCCRTKRGWRSRAHQAHIVGLAFVVRKYI